MAYSIGILVGPMIAGVIMSCPDLKPNGFQVLMLTFAGVILISCPVMINFKTMFSK